MATLRRVSAGRASLLVTHRLGTVIDADEILVLDRGQVVERGTHTELLSRDGLYSELQRRYRALPTEVLV
jgi:ATP-binding cassette subfamily B protein